MRGLFSGVPPAREYHLKQNNDGTALSEEVSDFKYLLPGWLAQQREKDIKIHNGAAWRACSIYINKDLEIHLTKAAETSEFCCHACSPVWL